MINMVKLCFQVYDHDDDGAGKVYANGWIITRESHLDPLITILEDHLRFDRDIDISLATVHEEDEDDR